MNQRRQVGKLPAVKMCMVGDVAVGKTSLARVFLQQPFVEKYQATIGGVVMSRDLADPQVTCQVWDTAGMERFRALLPHYMRGARAAIICYDITSRASFQAVSNHWLEFVECCGQVDIVRVLVATKMDVPEGQRAVTEKEGMRLAESNGMIFLESSAKLGVNVDEIFIQAAKRVVETTVCSNGQSDISITTHKEQDTGAIRLTQKQMKKKSCCTRSSSEDTFVT